MSISLDLDERKNTNVFTNAFVFQDFGEMPIDNFEHATTQANMHLQNNSCIELQLLHA